MNIEAEGSNEQDYLPGKLLEKERAYIRSRRRAAGVDPQDDGCPVGLAISGRNLHQAMFALGVVQSLSAKGVFKLVDLLSATSFGAYVASWLTSLMTIRNPSATSVSRHDEWAEEKESLGVGRRSPTLRSDLTEQMHEGLNRQWLAGSLVGRFGAQAMTGGLSAVWIATLLFFVIGAVFFYTALFGSVGFWSEIAAVNQEMEWAALHLGFLPSINGLIWPFVFGAVTAYVLIWLLYGAGKRFLSEGTASDPRRRHFCYCVWTTVMVSGVSLTSRLNGGDAAEGWPFLFSPAAGFAGTVACASLLFTFAERAGLKGLLAGIGRSEVYVAQGINWILLICAFSASVVVMVEASFWRFETHHWLGLVGCLAVVFLVSGTDNTGWGRSQNSRRRRSRRRKRVHQVGAILATYSFVVLAAKLLSQSVLGTWLDGWLLFLLLPIAVAWMWFLGAWVDWNQWSPQRFRHESIASIFFTNEPVKERAAEGGRNDLQMRLHEILDRFEASRTGWKPAPNPMPYALIVADLMQPGGRGLSGASRTVCPFIFSREFCGSDETGYVPTLYYREGMTTLNEATFMAACTDDSSIKNATGELLSHLIPGRHGVWIENPRFYGKDTLLNRREGADTVRFQAPEFSEKRWLWPRFFIRELMDRVSSEHSFVQLRDASSSGDPFGVFPLLQRRCKLIFVCDGESDAAAGTAALMSTLRRFRMDHELSIDFEEPRTASAASAGGFQVGRIRYGGDVGDPGEGEDGWIVYFNCSGLNDVVSENPSYEEGDAAESRSGLDSFRAAGVAVAEDFLRSVKECDFRGELGDDGLRNPQLFYKWCRERIEGYVE